MADSKDPLGNRQKEYEGAETSRKLMSLCPVLIRCDGKGFSKFTKGLERPYDINMSRVMALTTQYLVEETNARIGYTESDEISLVLYSDSYDSQVFFDGKIQKLVSVVASMATAKFNSLITEYLPSKVGKLAIFDARVWNTPTLEEAANAILWRTFDAEKNSISSAARTVCSHKELNGKNRSEQLQMMEVRGLIWGDFPEFFKRGTFYRREKIMIELDEEERLKIPEKFRPELGTKVERTVVREMYTPPFSKVVNRVGVIFNGETPMDAQDRIDKMIEEDKPSAWSRYGA